MLTKLAAAALVAGLLGVPVPGELPEPAPADLLRATTHADMAADGILVDALLTLRPGARLAQADLAPRGIEVLRTFPDFGVLAVRATPDALQGLQGHAAIAGVYPNAPLQLHLATATIATGARAAWDAKSTSTSPAAVAGEVVDGSGVGIAIVDTGVDATHPDLAPAVATDLRFTCSTPALVSASTDTCYGNDAAGQVLDGAGDPGCEDRFWTPTSNTDLTSGHGTHVASIAAGRGVASDGRFMGAAPGARIHALGIGEVILPLYVLEAFHWVLCHHATAEPPIRVVSNSWGAPGPFDADDPVNRAVDALVGEGLLVVFSAGNDGGAGVQDQLSRFGRNPRPGVVMVANADDQGIATRTGGIDASSSCGVASGDAAQWPDVAAPGVDIAAAHGFPGPAIGPPSEPNYAPYYVAATGTSMAAPHVAGIAALLLQAHPGLRPAALEDVLRDHATLIPGTSAPCAGEGMVDALASLADARVGARGGSLLPRMSANPHVYVAGTDAQAVSGVQWTLPRGQAVRLAERLLRSGDDTAYPLTAGQEARYRLACPGGVVLLPTTLAPDGAGEGLRMDATTAFSGPQGDCRVEAHVRFAAGWLAFDAFTVRLA